MAKMTSFMLAAALTATVWAFPAQAQTGNTTFTTQQGGSPAAISSSVGTPAETTQTTNGFPGLSASKGMGGTADQILTTAQDPVTQQVHVFTPPVIPTAPVAPTTPVVQAQPAATTATQQAPTEVDPCAAFNTSQDLYISCQDRMAKIKRMQSVHQQSATPATAAPAAAAATATPAADDPATIAAAAAAAAVKANTSTNIKKGMMRERIKK